MEIFFLGFLLDWPDDIFIDEKKFIFSPYREEG